jgi:hypothetical protein
MDKPYYELVGCYPIRNTEQWREVFAHEFDSLEDAKSFAETNLEEYAIYMKMKIEEKKHEN